MLAPHGDGVDRIHQAADLLAGFNSGGRILSSAVKRGSQGLGAEARGSRPGGGGGGGEEDEEEDGSWNAPSAFANN